MTTKSSGNVFADLGLPYPNALLVLADLKIAWNKVLTERIPDDLRRLVEGLR